MSSRGSSRSAVAAVAAIAVATCAGVRNDPETTVTAGGGAGRYQYHSSGCASTGYQAQEVVGFAEVRHEFEGHLVASAAGAYVPATTVSEDGGRGTERPYALAARIGGKWPAVEFQIGPQVRVGPQYETLILPDASLRLGPEVAYGWAEAWTQRSAGAVETAVQAGVGSESEYGLARVGITGAQAGVGFVGRGLVAIGPSWRVGAEGVSAQSFGPFDGPDWRAMALVQRRIRSVGRTDR